MVLGSNKALSGAENRLPKPAVMIFMLATFIAPPVILPFTKGPKMGIPLPVAITFGIIILAANFIIKFLGQKKLGAMPAPASKKNGSLVTEGIYGKIRHPLYMSNGLLAIGMAILLSSLYALLFSIIYFFLFLPIIYLEEKNLVKEYGKKYLDYKRKVPWMMIPKLF